MVITVAILVWLAIGLFVGLIVWRDSLLGLDKAANPLEWAGIAVLGVPILCVALVLAGIDLITGRR